MNITFNAWRLEAEYGEYNIGSDGNNACSGLTPDEPGARTRRQLQ